jgi:hypothetical protein
MTSYGWPHPPELDRGAWSCSWRGEVNKRLTTAQPAGRFSANDSPGL